MNQRIMSPSSPLGALRRHAQRLLGLLLAAAVASIALVATVPAPCAHACSCVEFTVDEAIDHADLIAQVTVIKRESGGEETTYQVAVDTQWKGPDERVITLSTSEDITACGLGRLKPGSSLLLWATGSGTDFSADWCSIPYDMPDDIEGTLTQKLGEPLDLTDQPTPTPEDPESPSDSPFPIPDVALIVLIGIVVLGVLMVGAAVVVVAIVVATRGRRAPSRQGSTSQGSSGHE